jgi:hypothetical protein
MSFRYMVISFRALFVRFDQFDHKNLGTFALCKIDGKEFQIIHFLSLGGLTR